MKLKDSKDHRLERALRSSLTEIRKSTEARFKLESVINNSPVIVFFWKAREGRQVEFVSQNISYLGYSSEELLSGGFFYDSLIHPDDKEYIFSLLDSCINGESESFEAEYRLITGSGEIKWVYERTSFVNDADGGFHGLVFDITKRKLAEQAIMEKEKDISILYSSATVASGSLDINELLNSVLMEIADLFSIEAGAIYIIDHDARVAMRSAYIGPEEEFVDILYYSRTDDMFRDLSSMPGKGIPGKYNEDNELIIERDLIFYLYSRDMVIGFVHLLFCESHIVDDEKLRLLEHVGRNIGIAVENALLFEKTRNAYNELKSVDMMKDQFFANLSHELKTPMISIKGFSELLGDGRFGELNEEQRRANDAVVRNACRLKRLIDSLLYISMEKEGKFKYDFRPLKINKVIATAIVKAKLNEENCEVSFVQNIPDDIPDVYGDEERLTNAFTNIFDNAIKFMPRGEITTRVINEAGHLHISIQDKGIGIPEEKLHKVFDSFYQVDGSLTRNFGGLGLGLHVSKRIIEVHSGRIWIKSNEGLGTVVHILLPV